jgi:hypothetical protein
MDEKSFITWGNNGVNSPSVFPLNYSHFFTLDHLKGTEHMLTIIKRPNLQK